jgi:hypothetical protein
MTDFTDGTTTGVVTKDIVPGMGVKCLQVRVPATFVWGTDNLIIDLKNYGCNKVAGVLAFEETTAGSVTVQATEGTTSVSSSVLTIASGGSGTNGGTFLIWAYS